MVRRTRMWSDRIEEAYRAGRFTHEDSADSTSWYHCAVGEQLRRHRHRAQDPRRVPVPGCEPPDNLLIKLGVEFSYRVLLGRIRPFRRGRRKSIDKAAAVYRRISDRVDLLY